MDKRINKILDKHERTFTKVYKGLDPDFSFYTRDDVRKVLRDMVNELFVVLYFNKDEHK